MSIFPISNVANGKEQKDGRQHAENIEYYDSGKHNEGALSRDAVGKPNEGAGSRDAVGKPDESTGSRDAARECNEGAGSRDAARECSVVYGCHMTRNRRSFTCKK